MKYKPDIDFDTVQVKLVESSINSNIKIHPNVDKDLFNQEKLIKPKRAMNNEFLCFKYTVKDYEKMKDLLTFSLWLQQFDD